MSGLLERVWKEREENVYKALFPNMPRDIYTPISADQIAIGGSELILSCYGVYEIPPTPERNYWTYITSGLSNPEGDTPQAANEDMLEDIGFGFELIMQLPEKETWPINFLFNIMGYLLETVNFFEPGDLMPCNGSIIAGDANCQLTNMLFWPPELLPETFQLETGTIGLLQIHPITELEYQFAENNSSLDLYSKLQTLPNFPIMDKTRASII